MMISCDTQKVFPYRDSRSELAHLDGALVDEPLDVQFAGTAGHLAGENDVIADEHFHLDGALVDRRRRCNSCTMLVNMQGK